MIERWKYVGSADVTEASPFVPDPAYETLAALQEAIEGKGGLIDIESKRAGDDPFRVDMTAGINGSDGETLDVDIYVVSRTQLEGGDDLGLIVEKVGDAQFTRHTSAVPAAIGGRSGHAFPDAVSANSTGLLEARTSRTPTPTSNAVSVLTLPDVGPASHVLILPGNGGSSTGGDVIARAWS